MVINANTSSMIAQRNYGMAGIALADSMERMATGSRINRGADDPAGLISSESLKAALAQLDAESSGMERTDAVANVADGAMSEISGLLSDANAAAVAMANTGGMSQSERDAYQMEIDSSMQAVDRIASTTTFNGQKVLDGSMTLTAGGSSVTIGSSATGDSGQVSVGGNNYTLADIMSGRGLDASKGNAEGAQQAIAAAMSQVATMRGQVGAFQKDVIAPALRSNSVTMENTASANSMIRDTDYAAESGAFARGQMLQGSSLKVLAMANSSQAAALRILG